MNVISPPPLRVATDAPPDLDIEHAPLCGTDATCPRCLVLAGEKVLARANWRRWLTDMLAVHAHHLESLANQAVDAPYAKGEGYEGTAVREYAARMREAAAVLRRGL